MSTEEKKLPQPPVGEAKQESKNRIRAMFLGLVIVMLMSSLNQTILAPSLPTIVGAYELGDYHFHPAVDDYDAGLRQAF